jgi:plasmid maintenance system antidote protein VapI
LEKLGSDPIYSLGRSPESWLAMQDAHDLWLARQSTDLARVSKLELAAA